jgi:hypothetical protein
MTAKELQSLWLRVCINEFGKDLGICIYERFQEEKAVLTGSLLWNAIRNPKQFQAFQHPVMDVVLAYGRKNSFVTFLEELKLHPETLQIRELPTKDTVLGEYIKQTSLDFLASWLCGETLVTERPEALKTGVSSGRTNSELSLREFLIFVDWFKCGCSIDLPEKTTLKIVETQWLDTIDLCVFNDRKNIERITGNMSCEIPIFTKASVELNIKTIDDEIAELSHYSGSSSGSPSST